MYLKELSINGFKSFAKKSELEFSVPITAIVGPNGSGKSNVAESFRFVLGEQSVKSMRGKRGEDLIWGGSEKVSRGNRASVELVFDNTARTFTLDFDEVRIERVVHRDGQNEYKLNGSTVRLKDIHELLANANIGSTGHHIISQGEADRVLAAGPKERREIIEDALGLKVYQLKKHEAERKLERTKENIAQVESLRREAAPHLKYLKKQVEKAERSLEVQKDLRTRYAEYLKREDVYVASHHDRLIAERREPQAKLEEVTERLVVVKEQLKEFENEAEKPSDTAAEDAYKTAARERQEAERVVSGLAGQVSFLERRLAVEVKPEEQAETVVMKRDEVTSIISAIEEAVEKVLGGEEADYFRRAFKSITERLQAFLETKQKHVVDTKTEDEAELKRLQAELETARGVLAKAVEREKVLQAEYAASQQAVVSQVNEEREAERTLFTLQNERRELELELARIDQELAVLERDRIDFKQQLQEAVTLLGRGAADYYNFQVLNTEGGELTDTEIAAEDRAAQRARQHELEKLKIRLEELGIGATEDLLKEYKDAQERDEFLAHELQDLQSSVQNLLDLIAEMEGQLREQFSAGIGKIGKEFQHFFTLMFGGGAASLEVVKLKRSGDEEGEESDAGEGVDLSVSLPNKRVKGLEMLSGGERALTSIALIFAMSQVNPPPFIILDETDAALDEANSRRYGDMIEALAKKSQLVLITHNRETMSRAGILYGITMAGDGVSRVLSVKFDEAVAVAK